MRAMIGCESKNERLNKSNLPPFVPSKHDIAN